MPSAWLIGYAWLKVRGAKTKTKTEDDDEDENEDEDCLRDAA